MLHVNKTIQNVFSYPLAFLLIIVFEYFTTITRAFMPLSLDHFVALLKYFLLTIVVFYKIKDLFHHYMVMATVLFVFNTWNSIYSLFFLENTSLIAHTNLFVSYIGVFIGLIWVKRKKNTILKYTSLAIGLSLATFCCTYFFNFLNFYSLQNFTGLVSEKIALSEMAFTDRNADTFYFENDKLYILDLWNTGCGYCFEKFPDFNKRYLNNNRTDIQYYSVNSPLERIDEENTAFDILKKYDYSFPQLKLHGDAIELFKINGFPKVIGLRNDTILFRGYLEMVDDFIKKYDKIYQPI